MDKNTIALAVLLFFGFGALGFGLANLPSPVVNVAGPVVNIPSNPVDVNLPSLGAFETGKVRFSGLSEGVLQSTRVFISSASFLDLDTGSVVILASSSSSGGTAGQRINEFISATVESNPSSESYSNFRGFNIYVKDPVTANIIASASPFAALGSGSNQRTQVIQRSVCQFTTGVQFTCPNAGAFRNVASSSAFYLKQSIEQNTDILNGDTTGGNRGGETSFWVTVYYRVYETF